MVPWHHIITIFKTLFFFTTQIFLWDVRKYVSVTVRHIPWSPTPLLYIGLRVPRGVLTDRCLLPNANWITPVWLSLPEGWGGGQLATGLLSCVCLRGRSGDCGTVVCLCRGPKSFTWHSLAEEQKAQMLDLWKEISAVSRVLALISCKTTQERGWMSAPGRLLCQHQRLRVLGAHSVCVMCMFLCMCVPWPATAWAVNKR